MTDLERRAIAARRALLGIEARAETILQKAYGAVIERLHENMVEVLRRIAEAQRRNEPVNPAWLYREGRYRALIRDLQAGLASAGGTATAAITAGQRGAADQAPGDAADLAIAALSPGPPATIRAVRESFAGIASKVLDAFVGRTVTGVPLAPFLLELAPDAADRVKNTLAYAVATGQAPRVTARAVRDEADVTLARALTISRTEILGSYRAATHVAYEHSAVVERWQWYATLGSERLCLVCLSMHGSIHPLDDPLASHPSCRCVALPVLAGPNPSAPALETGEEVFARLTRPEKLAVVGPARLALLDAGKVRLPDLVRRTSSVRYGPGRRAATLDELGA